MITEPYLPWKGSEWVYKGLVRSTSEHIPKCSMTLETDHVPRSGLCSSHVDLSPELLIEGPGKSSLTTGEAADMSKRLGVSCSVSLYKAKWCKGEPNGSYECQHQAPPQDHALEWGLQISKHLESENVPPKQGK